MKLLLLSHNALLLSEKSHSLSGLSIGIELQHRIEVRERVLLERCSLNIFLNGPDHGLDLVGVNDTGQVRVDHLGPGKQVALFLLGGLIEGSIDRVQFLKCGLGPNNEPSKVATGCQLQKVEPINVCLLYTGNVPEGFNGLSTFCSVHYKRTLARDIPAVPHFSLPGTNSVAEFSFLRVCECADFLENFDGFFGFLDAFDSVADDEGEFRDGLDAVAASLDERGDCGGGDGGDDGVALLLNVDLAVPAAPDLGGSKHAAATAHVSEGALAGAVGTTAGDSRDTRDGAAGAPGLGGGLVAGALADGVGLAAVARNVGVDEIDDVRPNGGFHDVGKRNGRGCIAL